VISFQQLVGLRARQIADCLGWEPGLAFSRTARPKACARHFRPLPPNEMKWRFSVDLRDDSGVLVRRVATLNENALAILHFSLVSRFPSPSCSGTPTAQLRHPCQRLFRIRQIFETGFSSFSSLCLERDLVYIRGSRQAENIV